VDHKLEFVTRWISYLCKVKIESSIFGLGTAKHVTSMPPMNSPPSKTWGAAWNLNRDYKLNT